MSRLLKPKDLDAYSEISLALAQATMQQAIDASGLDRGTVAKRFCDSPRRRLRATWRLDRLLSGDCDLTLRDMGRLLAICGFEVRFDQIPRLTLNRTGMRQGKSWIQWEKKARMLRSSTYGLQDRPSCAPKPDADVVLSDRRVLAALEKHAEIQADFDDFDGDRRGISQHLWDAKSEIVKSVARALQSRSLGHQKRERNPRKLTWLRKGAKIRYLGCRNGFDDVFVVGTVGRASKTKPAWFVARRRDPVAGQAKTVVVSCTPEAMRSWQKHEGD